MRKTMKPPGLIPVDIMKKRFGGFVMAVNVSPQMDLGLPANLDRIPSSWNYLWRRLNPFKKKVVLPTILDIMMRTIMLSSVNHSNQVREEANFYFNPPLDRFGLLDFKCLQEIESAAYEYAIQELSDWKLSAEKAWQSKLSACM